jgi:hypothetical protein
MRYSLVISLIVHAGILLAAVYVLPEPDEFKPKEQESIAVDVIEFADTVQKVATKKDSKPVPKKPPLPPKVEKVAKSEPAPKPAKKVEKAVVEPQPEPEPVRDVKKAEPEPDPLKELIKKAEALPEPKPEPEPEPKKTEALAKPIPTPRVKPRIPKSFKVAQKKAKKKKHKFDPKKLTVLLNKIDEDRAAPPDPSEVDGTPADSKINDILQGEDAKLTGTEMSWLINRIGQCWSPPIGMKESGVVIPKVVFEMDIEGNVQGTPRVVNRSANPLFEVAARSAVNAVLSCAPYSQMPPEKYATWRVIAVNFDPRIMLGIN